MQPVCVCVPRGHTHTSIFTSGMSALPSADEVARLVQAQYARLPKTGKPQPGEWTVLAGITLVRPGAPAEVVALGTGTKCLTVSQVAADAQGECVHDAHAEVCARRALRAFLIAELKSLAKSSPSTVVQPISGGGGFELRPGVQLVLYTSEPPCGDAAIFTTSGELPCAEDPGACTATTEPTAKRPRPADDESGTGHGQQPAVTLHRTGARPAAQSALEAEASSGGAVCLPGLVRTKPGRGERTCCMSCSDKLARWQEIGIQGALLSLLMPAPIRLASIVVGQPSSIDALRRAVGRCATARSGGVEASQAVQLGSTALRFEHASPPEATDAASAAAHTCSNSLVWASCGVSEALNGLSGKRLGANKRAPSPKHRSQVCKALLLQQILELVALLPPDLLPSTLAEMQHAMWSRTHPCDRRRRTYAEAKALATAYQQRKATLTGPGGPLSDWVRAPCVCEQLQLTDVKDASDHNGQCE